jgi:hypothetical protein
MDPPKQGGEGNTDIAALSAGVAAVAVSMFVIPGPFDVLGAIVAVTLTLVIFGYVWEHPRTRRRSLAVSALLGVIAIPLFGFILEMYFAQDRWVRLTCAPHSSCPDYPPAVDTSVNSILQICIWIIVWILAYIADRRKQKNSQ